MRKSCENRDDFFSSFVFSWGNGEPQVFVGLQIKKSNILYNPLEKEPDEQTTCARNLESDFKRKYLSCMQDVVRQRQHLKFYSHA